MHQFGWLSERGGGGGLFKFASDRGGTQKGGGGVPTLEETMIYIYISYNK